MLCESCWFKLCKINLLTSERGQLDDDWFEDCFMNSLDDGRLGLIKLVNSIGDSLARSLGAAGTSYFVYSFNKGSLLC